MYISGQSPSARYWSFISPRRKIPQLATATVPVQVFFIAAHTATHPVQDTRLRQHGISDSRTVPAPSSDSDRHKHAPDQGPCTTTSTPTTPFSFSAGVPTPMHHTATPRLPSIGAMLGTVLNDTDAEPRADAARAWPPVPAYYPFHPVAAGLPTPRASTADIRGIGCFTPLAPLLAPLTYNHVPAASKKRLSASATGHTPSPQSTSPSSPSSDFGGRHEAALSSGSLGAAHATSAAGNPSGPLKCVCRNNTKVGHHIPRPRNAFILFRQHTHQRLFAKGAGDGPPAVASTPSASTPPSSESPAAEVSFKTNSQISREIGQRWRELGDEDRKYWHGLALQEKELHRQRYPDYKYIPRKSRTGRRQRKDGCEFCKQHRQA
ncbi:LADA_0B05358g1_1 [Lachancea dasiensis]|uniref:LADA_0B05358g1_1 n=1 Tax=Lachancea dasiensis TaxID=1072105 RepID=A0A1G4IT69_9SACH|nr:LADA_0B05358g1_1 [Lachancea dasiensis]